MIVLSIAGLILLIVFLAVPAMQRNLRNYERKRVVVSILAESINHQSFFKTRNFQGEHPSEISHNCRILELYASDFVGGIDTCGNNYTNYGRYLIATTINGYELCVANR